MAKYNEKRFIYTHKHHNIAKNSIKNHFYVIQEL